MALRYNSSTFFLAQGVLLKNFKLDLTLGSSVKHLIVIRLPNSSQPYCSTRWVRIISSVMPCKGFWGCSLVIILSIQLITRPAAQPPRIYFPRNFASASLTSFPFCSMISSNSSGERKSSSCLAFGLTALRS